MFFTIMIIIIAIAFFVINASKMIRDNSTNNLYLLIAQFIGVVIAFLELLITNNIKFVGYIFVILFSIIIPILSFFLEKKKLNLDEVIRLFFVNYKRNDVKEQLLKIIDRYPDSYLAHKKLAEYYETNNENNKAEDEYIKVVQENENDYKTYCKLSEVLIKNGKQEEAIQTLKLVLHKKPSYIEASMLLGSTLYDDEKYKEAISVYYDAIKYHPGEYDIYYRLGMTFVRLSDFQNAKDCYKKAATLNSLKDVSELNLGQIDMIFKDYDGAEKYFFGIIDSDDNKISAYAYYNLAKIKIIRKDEDNATKFVNLAIELYPDIAKKVERDEDFLCILGNVKLKHYKEIKSNVKQEDEQIISYLENTFEKIKNLTSSYDEIRTTLNKTNEQRER